MVSGKWAVVAWNPVVSNNPITPWIAYRGGYEEAKQVEWSLKRDGWRAETRPEGEVLKDGDSRDEAEGDEAAEELPSII